MSEQGGGGPITREQVERAIERSQVADQRGINDALGYPWYAQAPGDVRYAWDFRHARCWTPLTAALTRWRDELAAAESVRRVARWDAERQRYMLTPPSTTSHQYNPSTPDRETAIAWGYEIEGGPEPIDDSCPERLRERREALGWTTAYAGHWVPWFDHTDVERAESGKGITAFVARYAAALSAEEARRAEEERLACSYRESDGTLVWDDSPLPEPERPAPRFKVGDWVRDGSRGFRVAEMHWDDSDVVPMWYARAAVGVAEGIAESSLESYAGPASPPAPEVVDVPQPIVKRCGMVEATYYPHAADVVTVELDDAPDVIDVPLALLRAMLEAIDAQQGGAS